ncbi:hypothetical protein [Streptosporangium sandarakinum]
MTDRDATGQGSAMDLLERIGSVVLPVGIALYALLYLGVQQMYGIFNISPEQAGIDQATMFGRLVGSLVLLILAGSLVLGGLVAVCWLVNRATLGHAARLARAVRARPWAAAALGAVWCGATYWGFLGYLDLDEGAGLASIVLVATVIGTVSFLVPFRLLRRRPTGRAGMRVVIAAFTGIGLGFALIGQLEADAEALASTGRGSIVLSLAGFQDQWVVAVTPAKGTPLYGGAPLLLLGEHEGTYAFYDCARRETFRRPMGATVLQGIELEPDHEDFTCGEPAPAKNAAAERTPAEDATAGNGSPRTGSAKTGSARTGSVERGSTERSPVRSGSGRTPTPAPSDGQGG